MPIPKIKWAFPQTENNNNNNNNDNNNNSNNNKRAYPNPCSGQCMLALIGWFERAVTLCGGKKSPKASVTSLKFRLLDWRTGYLNWSPDRYRPL